MRLHRQTRSAPTVPSPDTSAVLREVGSAGAAPETPAQCRFLVPVSIAGPSDGFCFELESALVTVRLRLADRIDNFLADG